MLRAIIIDDEEDGINAIRLLTQQFVPDVKIVNSSTESSAGIELIDNYRPEVVFLDINMPFLNGFELLEKLTYRDFSLVFVTAHEEYALKAIKENAIDYLLKPIDPQELIEAIDKIKKKRETKELQSDFLGLLQAFPKPEKTRLALPAKNGFIYAGLHQVIRLEADSNYTKVVLLDGTSHMVAKTLKEYEDILCTGDLGFMRIHQSHIVNLKNVLRYIKTDGGLVVTQDEARIPLSKQRKDEFMAWLKI
ncbi:MAG: LytR/AlgR family response regulator transcription factor [Bacteroidia bacterium]